MPVIAPARHLQSILWCLHLLVDFWCGLTQNPGKNGSQIYSVLLIGI